jgi:hypothetical protein
MRSDVVQNSNQNVVAQVLNTAGIQMSNAIGPVSKPGALVEHAGNCMVNAALIAKVGQAFEQQNADRSSAAPSQTQALLSAPQSNFMSNVIGVGATLAAAAVSPLAGAVVGTAFTMKDVVDFSTGHAAVDGAKGELTIAGAASFDQRGEMVSYSPACEEGISYNMSGKATQSPSPLDQKIGLAVSEIGDQFSQDRIQGDLRKAMEKQMADYGWAQNKLDMLYGIKLDSLDSKKILELALLGDEMSPGGPASPQKPRPIGLNVGMGAPTP